MPYFLSNNLHTIKKTNLFWPLKKQPLFLSQQAWNTSDEAGMEMMNLKTTDVEDPVCDPSCSESSSFQEADLGAGGHFIGDSLFIGLPKWQCFFCCT